MGREIFEVARVTFEFKLADNAIDSIEHATPGKENTLPKNIKDRFSFRELDEQTFSAPASDSAIGEVPQGEGVKELSPSPEEQAITY